MNSSAIAGINRSSDSRSSSRRPLLARKRSARASRVVQQELHFAGWGGARRGAGRKRQSLRPSISHRARGAHQARNPVLVTTRLHVGLASLRQCREYLVVRQAFSSRTARSTFQVVHHSIQSNHLHLIVEAEDRRALSAGLRRLLARIARGLNRLWKRSGAVLADRFHERELRTPREVRNALVYVLQNARKHGIGTRGPDPLSSGPWFDGWMASRAFHGIAERVRAALEKLDSPPPGGLASRAGSGTARAPGSTADTTPEASAATASAPSWLSRPRTWLLGCGWRRSGLIDPRESPA